VRLARRLGLLACALAISCAAGAMALDEDQAIVLSVTEPAAVPEEKKAPSIVPEPLREIGRGIASWYGGHFHGRRTASGERFDKDALTAAHPTLPFGTVVRVRSLVNGKEVDVRINDRGPFVGRRMIDLSQGAAKALGLVDAGTGTKPVTLSLLPRGTTLTPPREVIRLEGSRRGWGEPRATEPPAD
jgi:rare lipoprotein A